MDFWLLRLICLILILTVAILSLETLTALLEMPRMERFGEKKTSSTVVTFYSTKCTVFRGEKQCIPFEIKVWNKWLSASLNTILIADVLTFELALDVRYKPQFYCIPEEIYLTGEAFRE